MDAPEDPVHLPAVHADDQLIEAIIDGASPASTDPTESRLIELLVHWHRGIARGRVED